MSIATPRKTSSLAKQVRAILRKRKTVSDQIEAVASLLQADAEFATKYAERTWLSLAAEFVACERHRLRQLPAASYMEKHRESMVSTGRRLGLFDDYFVGDKVLGDCTASDLEEAAFKREQSAKGMQREADFLRKLAEKCGDKKVRKAWKLEDAEALKRRLEGDAQ